MKAFVGHPQFKGRMMSALSGKLVQVTAEKYKIPLKDALVILLLDDFWDSLK